MSQSNIIRFSNVTVRRGSKTILDNINWTVKEGEHWVILGANGSGKTSLLNTLAAYLTISQGEFEFLGYKYGTSDWRELRKKIGLVSDTILNKINFHETCIETVASGKHAMINYWGRIAEREHDRANEILRRIDCELLAERRWGSLSQGEKQRILIGRALMADSRVLILDEPCAGLDPVARENFLAFLSRLAQDNTALVLLFVTHHVEEIMPFLSHVLIMKDGKILAAGEKEKVLISATLSKAFGTDIELCRENSRYSISIKTEIDVVL